MGIKAVFFDLGETLVDETNLWGGWADWLGVPRLTFFAVLGSLIAQRDHHRGVFEYFRPGFDLEAERARRASAGFPDELTVDDLYPEAWECLENLRTAGYRVGIAGNYSARSSEVIRRWGVPADTVASSEEWGAEKPSPVFFERLIETAALPASQIAYVGDRVDNDVVPAVRAGLQAVFIRRGPWGHHQADWPEAGQAALRIDTLSELPASIRSLETQFPGDGD